ARAGRGEEPGVPDAIEGGGRSRASNGSAVRFLRGRRIVMQVRKMQLSRRTLLRGLGTAVALPLLDAMVPSFTALAKTAANPQRRFGAIYIPHGAILDRYTPHNQGSGVDF